MSNSFSTTIPEKLGSFYLGSAFDLGAGSVAGPRIHYDARDLTTHAVCVGMTGSGKTGLCVGLLEEAALDRIPAIIIDPKGDMGNLLLHFPELQPSDFAPWINADDARRKDLSVDAFADKTAALWKSGLLDSGIGSDRIRALSKAVDYAIYTPGSESVRPVNILGSLQAPNETDVEALRDRIAGTVGALLGLVGIDADPVQSKEAIFLSVVFEHFWKDGRNMDLGLLVRCIQDPPVRKFGVFDVDSFFPENERFKLAMAMNNLMASPSFAAWLTGAPLDIDSLLYQPDGTPKHSIFYIAHLSDPERMFFVTLLLNALVTWVRQQPGTTSLRSLLYFDEVFGFLPPVAAPPSKGPLLTLLKQARAFGLGTVLVTQNPADLDYKALSNAGTWFIGRLQSKQDQQRLLEGLKKADVAGGTDTGKLSEAIGQLKSRVFLMNNVHEDEPVVFHTRWAMNYLRGPLTRTQLKVLAKPTSGRTTSDSRESTAPAGAKSHTPSPRPALPPGLHERFLTASLPSQLSTDDRLAYHSTIGALATTHFVDKRRDISTKETTLHFFNPDALGPNPTWSDSAAHPASDGQLLETPALADVSFVGGLPEGCNTKADAQSLRKELDDWIYHNRRLSLLFNKDLDLCQRPDESESAFHSRVELAGRERRDAEIDEASERFQTKIERIEDKRRTVARSIDEQEDKYTARKQEELLSLGETVLGMVFGRRRRLSGVATKRRMTASARARLETLESRDQDLQMELNELEREARQEAEDIALRWEAGIRTITNLTISPRRTDVSVDFVGVLWLPYQQASGQDVDKPLYE